MMILGGAGRPEGKTRHIESLSASLWFNPWTAERGLKAEENCSEFKKTPVLISMEGRKEWGAACPVLHSLENNEFAMVERFVRFGLLKAGTSFHLCLLVGWHTLAIWRLNR